MSIGRIRRSVRSGTDESGVVALCLLLGVVELVLFYAAAIVTDGRDLVGTVAGIGLYRLLLVVALAAILPSCYAVYREGATLRETPATAVAALRTDGLRVLAASLVARTVAALATLALFALFVLFVLGVDTLSVWSDALLGVGLDRPTAFELGLLAAALAAAWLVNGLVDYQDLLVIDDRAGVAGAWKASASAVLARPRWYPWQALVRGLLLAAPWALTILAALALDAVGVPERGPLLLPFMLALGTLFVVVIAIARATLVAYHVETTDEVVGPALVAEPTPVRDNLGRVAVAAIVVLAAVGGVAAVRTGDVTPAPSGPDATLAPDDPAATLETAIARTYQRSHAKTERDEQFNETTGAWETTRWRDNRFDRTNARAIVVSRYGTGESPPERTLFVTDGAAAATGDYAEIYPNQMVQTSEVRDPWVLVIGISYGAIAEERRYLTPDDTDGWRLRQANESTLVYVMDDPVDFYGIDATTYAPDPSDPDITYHDESELSAVVDRENGTLEAVVRHVHFTDRYDEDDVEERTVRTTITYRDVGATTVERPGSLGGPGPLETVWDVVYYA